MLSVDVPTSGDGRNHPWSVTYLWQLQRCPLVTSSGEANLFEVLKCLCIECRALCLLKSGLEGTTVSTSVSLLHHMNFVLVGGSMI